MTVHERTERARPLARRREASAGRRALGPDPAAMRLDELACAQLPERDELGLGGGIQKSDVVDHMAPSLRHPWLHCVRTTSMAPSLRRTNAAVTSAARTSSRERVSRVSSRSTHPRDTAM